ncbi:MAG: NAD-dependent epimerase/dehydratase family protein [Solirubrobacterales bacterium]
MNEDFWRGRSVLLTGAQGFIGSWLADALLGAETELTCIVRDEPVRSRFEIEGLGEYCTLARCDLGDVRALERIVNEREIEAVFHLAAQAIVGTANRSPLSTFETNVRGTYNLLEACRLTSTVQRVVVASSDKAYGRHEQLPYREDAALVPRYPYDTSKAAADLIARSYAATYGLPVAVTRFANVYGGGDFNFSRIVPDTVRSLLEGRRPVLRSDGSPRRDFMYVEDAIGAYLAIAHALDRDDVRGLALNAGAGEAVPIIEVVERLIEIAGQRVEPEIQGSGAPAGEIDRQYLDSTLIAELIGWQPAWSLDDGLRETYAWYEGKLRSLPASIT